MTTLSVIFLFVVLTAITGLFLVVASLVGDLLRHATSRNTAITTSPIGRQIEIGAAVRCVAGVLPYMPRLTVSAFVAMLTMSIYSESILINCPA